MKTVHLLIKGKVQGVYYRASAQEAAVSLNITGWVRNTEEGHVEVRATGDEEQIKRFVEWCWQGPERAVVTDVSISSVDAEAFSSFSIHRSEY